MELCKNSGALYPSLVGAKAPLRMPGRFPPILKDLFNTGASAIRLRGKGGSRSSRTEPM